MNPVPANDYMETLILLEVCFSIQFGPQAIEKLYTIFLVLAL